MNTTKIKIIKLPL